jgi:hypothetical protein
MHYKTAFLTLLCLAVCTLASSAPRQLEALGRGLVAIQIGRAHV